LAIRIGDALVPALKELADQIIPVIEKISTWIKENPELAAGIVKWAAAIGAFNLIVGPMVGFLGKLVGGKLLTATAGGITASGIAALGATAPLWAWMLLIGSASLLAWKLSEELVGLTQDLEQLAESEERGVQQIEYMNERLGLSVTNEKELRTALNNKSQELLEKRLEQIRVEMEAELGRDVTLQELFVEENRRANERAGAMDAKTEEIKQEADIFEARKRNMVDFGASQAEANKAEVDAILNSQVVRQDDLGERQEMLAKKLGLTEEEISHFASIEEAIAHAAAVRVTMAGIEVDASEKKIGSIKIHGAELVAVISEERAAENEAYNKKLELWKKEEAARQTRVNATKRVLAAIVQAIKEGSGDAAKLFNELDADARVSLTAMVESAVKGTGDFANAFKQMTPVVQTQIIKVTGATAELETDTIAIGDAAKKGTKEYAGAFEVMVPVVQKHSRQIAQDIMTTSPFSEHSPSLVEQTNTGLDAMASKWMSFASGLHNVLNGLWEKIRQISPWAKGSPSLVEETETGLLRMGWNWRQFEGSIFAINQRIRAEQQRTIQEFKRNVYLTSLGLDLNRQRWSSYAQYLHELQLQHQEDLRESIRLTNLIQSGDDRFVSGDEGETYTSGTTSSSSSSNSLAAFSGAASNTSTVMLNVDARGATIREDADIEKLSQSLMKHVNRGLGRSGIQLGLAVSG